MMIAMKTNVVMLMAVAMMIQVEAVVEMNEGYDSGHDVYFCDGW